MNYNDLFINALYKNNLDLLKSIPKGDLHAHSTRSGSQKYFNNKYNVKIKSKDYFESIDEMNSWYNKEIKALFSNKMQSFSERIISAFIAAKEDSVKKLCLSFGLGNIKLFNGNINSYINKIEEIRKQYYNDYIFIPELCLVRGQISQTQNELITNLIKSNYFKSIDLVGDEKYGVNEFVDIYNLAEQHGMIKRCHVGEFCDYTYIDDAINKLRINEIQHGLSITQSNDLINKIRNKNIRINLCPESNLRLKRINLLENYILRCLIDNNINVTINTDDRLIFNKSISAEFLDLYNTGQYTAEELNDIRNNSLI
ncbi:MAG: hypothetical protein NC213_03790 [Acetobacter sp.]|nr:hypothetical protein [Bacteroides sp.]MCM1340846.1 hypothetical protein [Acetobacter sp.]MCM1432597.1 hypothetical protein [Clostridiales bacterium]